MFGYVQLTDFSHARHKKSVTILFAFLGYLFRHLPVNDSIVTNVRYLQV